MELPYMPITMPIHWPPSQPPQLIGIYGSPICGVWILHNIGAIPLALGPVEPVVADVGRFTTEIVAERLIGASKCSEGGEAVMRAAWT